MIMETPAATFERITGHKWPGGSSDEVVMLLRIFGIGWEPGTREANIVLQYCLLHANPVII